MNSTYQDVAACTEAHLHQILTPTEQRVIEVFTCHWMSSDAPLTVLGAMQAVPGVSPSTVHRKLKALRAKGLLTVDHGAIDTRVKHIVPTPLLLLTLDRFAENLGA